ncbi:hypothetical protein FOG50_02051 [Hanseniaspora uvarum]|nr:hypothetical protein FOG50_02051 [Hanseniaspora uvarum]
MTDNNNYNSNLSIVDEESIIDGDSKYEESLDIFRSVLDRLDEFTSKNVNNDSAAILSSNQSNTLINSLSKINNSTISSILYDNQSKNIKNETKDNPKMDSEYIINELLKRRTEYRSIIDKKQTLLKNKRKGFNKKLKNTLNFITETNDDEKAKKNKPLELTAEERLRQFQEFSKSLNNLPSQSNIIIDHNLSNQNGFEIDNFHNYKFKADNDNDDYLVDPLTRHRTIETWSQDEILENYDEILEQYLIYSSNFKNQHNELDGSVADLEDENINDTNSQFFNNSIFSKKPQKQSLKMSLIVGLIVALGGLIYGFDSGLINNLIGMSYFVEHFQTGDEGFTTSEISIIVTSLSIGTFTGALVAPFSMDRFGRKPTIIASVWFFLVIGNIVQITSINILSVIMGRLVSGFGVGILSAAIPNYQSEISHKDIRGAIICTFQWAITWGLLLSSVVSQGTHKMETKASYQIPMGLQFVWSFLLGIGMFYLPESPRYYVMKGQLNKAAEALSFVRGVSITDTVLLEELVEVKANYDYEMSLNTNGGILDCFKSSPTRYKQRLRLFTAVTLQFFQQMSGINFIFYYGITFFQESGVSSTFILSLITYAVNVVFNIPGLFLIDLIGRRQLLLWGAILMAICNYIVAIISSIKMPSSISKKGLETLKLTFICGFIGSFSATFGGCTWVVSAEIFPLGIRSQCTSISAAANWLANVICATMTPFIFNEGSAHRSDKSNSHSRIFFLWATLNFLAIFAVYFLVYETSGLTLEEIDELYVQSKNARDSVNVNKSIKTGDSYVTGFLTLAKNYKTTKNKNANHSSNNICLEDNKTIFEKKVSEGFESDIGDKETAYNTNSVTKDISNGNLTSPVESVFKLRKNSENSIKKESSKRSSLTNENQTSLDPYEADNMDIYDDEKQKHENYLKILELSSQLKMKHKTDKEQQTNENISLGNGLAITILPRSVPSTTGLSAGFTDNYEDIQRFEKLDEQDYLNYIDFKKDSFKPIQDPIFIANQRMTDPPNISSDEE